MRIRRRSGPGDGDAGWGVADGRGYSRCTGRKYFAFRVSYLYYGKNNKIEQFKKCVINMTLKYTIYLI